jgi:hypothetical protein
MESDREKDSLPLPSAPVGVSSFLPQTLAIETSLLKGHYFLTLSLLTSLYFPMFYSEPLFFPSLLLQNGPLEATDVFAVSPYSIDLLRPPVSLYPYHFFLCMAYSCAIMMKNRVSMMHQETSTRLHGITTQKTVLFK